MAHGYMQQLCAVVTTGNQEPHDCVTVNASHPLNTADAVAFEQGRDNSYFFGNCEGVHCGLSPLALSGEAGHNSFGSEAWVTPRFGLGPTPVSAGAGPLNYGIKCLGWRLNRDFYGLTDSEADNNSNSQHRCYILSRSPVYAGLLYFTARSFLFWGFETTSQHVNNSSGCHLLFLSSTKLNITSNLHFSSSKHSPQSSVDTGHYVAVLSQVIPHQNENVSNVSVAKGFRGICQGQTNSMGKHHCADGKGLPADSGKTHNNLSHK